MTPRRLILDFVQPSRSCRSVFLSGCGIPEAYRKEGVHFYFGDERLPEPATLDGFMFAFLHVAMAKADQFVVRGPVSRKALRNAYIYQEAWRCWLPDQYRVVELLPERIIDEPFFLFPRKKKAISLFSGGVDAVFLALRHSRPSPGSFAIRDVLTIHGYDAYLSPLLRRQRENRRQINEMRRLVQTGGGQANSLRWRRFLDSRRSKGDRYGT